MEEVWGHKIVEGGGMRVIKLVLFCGRHKCMTPKLVVFYDVQISKMLEKYIMCNVRGLLQSVRTRRGFVKL